MTASEVKRALQEKASPLRAAGTVRFFKTGPGQYGEGDVFIGVSAPTVRAIARGFRGLPFGEIEALLQSAIHEERQIALILLVHRYAKADRAGQKAAYEFYLENLGRVNNWNLVDLSAPAIVGAHLLDKNRKILDRLVKSKVLWERRIAIVATQHFIRNDEFGDTIKLSQALLKDPEDLIHKAAGWMLREVGDRDATVLAAFLNKYASQMPRTMLRYAIEKMDGGTRRMYLGKR